MARKKWQFYTAEGFRDYLPPACRRKREIEACLRRYFRLCDCEEIATPGLEFYQVYAASDFADDESLFKLSDEAGRLLTLRYDGTIPALRLAATKLQAAARSPRLFYIQNMFRFNEGGGGRQREFTQAGLELLATPGLLADAEAIALAIEASRQIGLPSLQVSLGHVGFSKALFSAWNLNGEARAELSTRIDERNQWGVLALAESLGLPASARRILELCFDRPLMEEELRSLCRSPELAFPDAARSELANLLAVMERLRDWGFAEYLAADLGLLQSMNYYTGLAYKGFTYGLGFPLFSGGRYDRAATGFGAEIPATGFSLGVDEALRALEAQGVPAPEEPPLALLALDPESPASARDAGRLDAALWSELREARKAGFRARLLTESEIQSLLAELPGFADKLAFEVRARRAAARLGAAELRLLSESGVRRIEVN